MHNKTIIITGASGSISRVLARTFAAAGANLVLVARNRENLMKMAAEFDESRILISPADASKVADMERVFAEAIEKFGRIDALVNAAGKWEQLSVDAPVMEASELADKHYEMFFRTTFVPSYIAQKIFRKQGSGLIANISSHAAVRPELPGNLTYGPMKAASRHLILALRHELKGTGVRLTDIEPAIVNTPEAASRLDTEEKRGAAVQPETIAQWIIDHFDDPNIPEEILFDAPAI